MSAQDGRTRVRDLSPDDQRRYRDARCFLFRWAGADPVYHKGDPETPARAEQRDRAYTARATFLMVARDLGMSTREPV